MVSNISGNFPGGNPQNAERIKNIGNNEYVIIPEYETEGIPAYKFRFDIKIINYNRSEEKTYEIQSPSVIS